MKTILEVLFARKRRKASKRASISTKPCRTQDDCLLFTKLSAELRILIYTAILVDPDRLLHFLWSVPDRGPLQKMGHWRCEEPDSPGPVWQHKCFGLWFENSSRRYRDTPNVSSDLLSILLTCRPIYFEAKEILYTQNHFSFRGVRGLSKFQSLIPTSDWSLLRHVHISTIFLTPMQFWRSGGFPPENYDDWTAGCEALATLPQLQLLKVDMVILAQRLRSEIGVDLESVIFILRTLKQVKARQFTVEINFEIPESVKDAIGKVPFDMIHRKRPYGVESFSV